MKNVPYLQSILAFGLAFVLVLTAGAGSVSAQTTSPESTEEITQSITSEIDAPVFAPQFLIIPELSVATQVESVGQNDSGAMDVPDNWRNAAWYKPGYLPGQNGRAVFAAHRDWKGSAGPFFRLDEMTAGDMVYTASSDGTILAYRVTNSKLFARGFDPSGSVFGAAPMPRLTLITCEGEYLEDSETYTDRRVVSADLAFSFADGEIKTYD